MTTKPMATIPLCIHTLRKANPLDFPPHLPVYALARSSVPWYDPKNIVRGWLAHAGTDLDVKLRPILRGLNQWQGRGFAFVVDDLGELSRLSGPNMLAELLGIVVHEASHFLEGHANPLKHGSTATRQAIRSDVMRRYLSGDCHGLAFTRSTLHLWFRTRSVYPRLEISHCRVAGDDYRLSHADEYLNAFGSELVRRVGEPIAEILKSPPPPAALELFEEDLKRRRSKVPI